MDKTDLTPSDSSNNDGENTKLLPRRQLLLWLTAITGTIGSAIAAWPLLSSLNPSAKARSLGEPIKIDISKLAMGEQLFVKWRGVPIWVLHRSPQMLEWIRNDQSGVILRDPDSEVASQQPDYAQNKVRSIKPNYLVVIGVCTHLGCVPMFRPEVRPKDLGEEWMGGYYCPCHKSKFDLAGRVYKGVPAPINLAIPPHQYVDNETILIGVDTKKRQT